MKEFFFVKYVVFFLGIFFSEIVIASSEEGLAKPRSVIHANYQVKASFFALPITAKIAVEKIEADIYQASIKLSSPFFKVNQKETARIKNCQVELLTIRSEGSRMNSDDWDEWIQITWPDRLVTYQDGQKKQFAYKAEFTPTGFTSLFAHQFAALAEQQTKPVPKALTYTQSSRGWRMDFIHEGRTENLKNKLFDKDVSADKFVIPRQGMSGEDVPSIWYKTEALGSFPLKMAMKLGVFRIETNLKKIDAKPEEIQRFFKEWGCSI